MMSRSSTSKSVNVALDTIKKDNLKNKHTESKSKRGAVFYVLHVDMIIL